MLTIKRDQTIGVSKALRSRYLWTALGIALGVHVLGLLLFTVRPFTLTHSDVVHPYVQVTAERLLAGDQVQIQHPEKQLPKEVYLPPETQPTFPSLFTTVFLPLPVINVPLHYKPIQIVPIGALAEHPFEATTPELTTQPPIRKLSRSQQVYQILVETDSGKVIWFHAQEPFVTTEQRKQMEEALTTITLKVDTGEPFVAGDVELILTVAEP
jgi:hypothetical protein